MKKVLGNIFAMRCPKCHSGPLFEYPLLSFKQWFTMKDKCSTCGQKFDIEPGFYWGAMYVGYIISAFFIFAFFGLFFFILNLSVENSFLLSMLCIIAMYGYIFRLARSLWINVNVRYDENAAPRNN